MRRPTLAALLTPFVLVALPGAASTAAGTVAAQGSAALPAASAQAPPNPSAAPADLGGNVENDPIRCWARTSSGAVRIGETFTVTLTCAVIETDLVQVVPDESKLGVAVMQMTPFEVAGGFHPADIKTNSRRFFQYDYNIRMINPDAIGTDVPIPLMQVTYRVNSRIAGNQQMQGREMTYVLPPMWVKVLSVVPQDATDIRDTDDASFSRVEQISFRAGVLQIVATTLMVLGGVMTLLALISIARRAAKQAKGPQERLLSRPALMRLAVRELSSAQQEGIASGWSDAALSRAAGALRLAAAGATDRVISQQVVESDVTASDGRFVVSRLGRVKRTAVSAAVTGVDIDRALRRAPEGSSRRQLLEELKQTMAALSAAQYSRPGADRNGVDTIVNKALELARQVRSHVSWPREWLRRFTARVPLLQRHA